jgi:hypothetical protein
MSMEPCCGRRGGTTNKEKLPITRRMSQRGAHKDKNGTNSQSFFGWRAGPWRGRCTWGQKQQMKRARKQTMTGPEQIRYHVSCSGRRGHGVDDARGQRQQVKGPRNQTNGSCALAPPDIQKILRVCAVPVYVARSRFGSLGPSLSAPPPPYQRLDESQGQQTQPPQPEGA